MSVQTGEYYFNARWYDPTLGRFISEDPIRDGLNWYVAMRNNPVVNIDPTGLWNSTNASDNPYDPGGDAYTGGTTYNPATGESSGEYNQYRPPIVGFTKEGDWPGRMAARDTGNWDNWTNLSIPGWDGDPGNVPVGEPYGYYTPEDSGTGDNPGIGGPDGPGIGGGEDPQPDPQYGPPYSPIGDRPDYGEGTRTPVRTQDYPVYQQWLFPEVGPCFVRAYQAIAEQYVGRYLSVEEIYEAKKNLVSSGAVESNWFVNDRAAVINDAFARLGFPHISAKFLGVFTNIDDVPDTTYAIVIDGAYREDNHGQTGDSQGNITFDPWHGGLVTEPISYRAFSITDTTQTTTRRR